MNIKIIFYFIFFFGGGGNSQSPRLHFYNTKCLSQDYFGHKSFICEPIFKNFAALFRNEKGVLE